MLNISQTRVRIVGSLVEEGVRDRGPGSQAENYNVFHFFTNGRRCGDVLDIVSTRAARGH
jgi:hypothetical protein